MAGLAFDEGEGAALFDKAAMMAVVEIYNNPKDIVGKEITVQYFEESQDKTGKYSLRFPVCKTVYENGRQV